MAVKITKLIPLIFVVSVAFSAVAPSTPSYAAVGDGLYSGDAFDATSGGAASNLAGDTNDLTLQGGVNAARGSGQPMELFGVGGIISTITDSLLFIIGALSVIMIIFGGLRYATSGGNSASVTAAKNTILYAIVGLIVAFLAYAAINFVLGTLTSGVSGGTL